MIKALQDEPVVSSQAMGEFLAGEVRQALSGLARSARKECASAAYESRCSLRGYISAAGLRKTPQNAKSQPADSKAPIRAFCPEDDPRSFGGHSVTPKLKRPRNPRKQAK